ncbi:hypothetical protein EMIT0111MI5_40249 [Burkholderia sp. IT-111MI5]
MVHIGPDPKKTKRCPMPPSLSDGNINIKSFSTDRKLTSAFSNFDLLRKRLRNEYKRFTATLCRRN